MEDGEGTRGEIVARSKAGWFTMRTGTGKELRYIYIYIYMGEKLKWSNAY